MINAKLFKRQTLDALRACEPATPRCIHIHECGGCAAQDRQYAEQVAVKRERLRSLWAGTLPDALPEHVDMVASPDPYNYRTRMDYVASTERFGLRRGRFNHVVDLHECHLIPPFAFDVARNVYEHARALGLPDYDLVTHTGYMRYVVVRRSHDDQLLLAIVTASTEHAEHMAQLAQFALAQPRVVGLHWLLNPAITDLALGETVQHWGAEMLDMQVGGRSLLITPNTFFQNNVHLLRPLLDDVAAQAGRADHIADLYGGVGTIALHLAGQARQITTVEEWPASAELAHINIERNRVANVAAVQSDVRAFLRTKSPGQYEVAIVDPPRVGLGPDVCRELLRLRPDRLVYVSCNPLTQVADARILLERFDVRVLRGYDMFPHTPHMEALCVFERRGARPR